MSGRLVTMAATMTAVGLMAAAIPARSPAAGQGVTAAVPDSGYVGQDVMMPMRDGKRLSGGPRARPARYRS